MLPPLRFTAETRLYQLDWLDTGPDLVVEAWWGKESLSEGFELVIDALATNAFLKLGPMLGQALRLATTASDGTTITRTGLVRAARKLGAEGGFARYRLTLVPWTWLLSRGRHNRVFQEKSVQQIIDLVFADYAEHAAWHWSDETAAFLADARPRNYCVQYRESDYAFVSRLLAEEGLGWCAEEDAGAPAGHRIRLFAESRNLPEDPLSLSANGGRGLRFHRADSQEDQDAIVAFGARRTLTTAIARTLSWNYQTKSSVTADVPTHHRYGGLHAPALPAYEDVGAGAHASQADAERYTRLSMEARESGYKRFLGRSTVRSLRPGTAFDLTGSPLDDLVANAHQQNADDQRRFAVLELIHAGINNLPGARIAQIAERLARETLHADAADDLSTDDAVQPLRAPTQLPAELLDLAAARGYGNCFEAQRAAIPWRPRLADDTGERINPRPTAPGPMSAIVVGPQGVTSPAGVDELWCDALGRIKVRFHWQQAERDDDRDTCWLRVQQRQAGAGMGWQWLPRIGQEVLVDFAHGDIDHPLVLGALYNGRGEGGVPPTPGGQAAPTADPTIFDQATDHLPAAQGNLTGGNSPAWHGAAARSHRHAAALSGFKSKEFGGTGYNQLVFDDTDGQQRIQLKSTQHTSELNLGHLIHQADNYRGSFRGAGVELRTDAWGAVRGGRGVIMSSWGHGAEAEPAGDLAAGAALTRQAAQLAQTLNQAARTHQTVQLAGTIGTHAAGQSAIDPKAAVYAALHTVTRGTVSGPDDAQAFSDAAAKHDAISQETVPHLTDPTIVQAARAGLGMIAGQHLQITADETATLMSGGDTNLAIAGKARIHAAQAIGLLAGAIEPGKGNAGLALTAARGDVDLQAQSDEMKFLARDQLKLVSANANIDFAAAKKIVLAVEGGASITIDGGITVACPGTITVHASKKSFSGPTRMNAEHPTFPKNVHKMPLRINFDHAPMGANSAWEGMPFKVFADGAQIQQGVLDSSGSLRIEHAAVTSSYRIEMANGVQYEIPIVDEFSNPKQGKLANQGFLKHRPGAPASDTGATRNSGQVRDTYHHGLTGGTTEAV